MLKVGLTGGIGSGKSTVCRLFAKLGVPIIDTDIIAHSVVLPGEPALDALTQVFGSTILGTDGCLDRSALREQVFQDEGKRQQLEAILHPVIRERMHTQLKSLNAPYVILAIPLLIEKRWQREIDRILVVDTPESLQQSRTMARDGASAQAVRRIMQAQCSRQQRMAEADDIIHNEGDYNDLTHQVEALHRFYLKLANE